MHPSRPRERRVRAESLRGYPLEPVAQALGYRCDPDDAARWRRPGSVLSTKIPRWIEAWNPRRIFCAWDATPNGDHAARRLARNDTRIVRMRPALDNQDWNHMLMCDRAGEPLESDDRQIN